MPMPIRWRSALLSALVLVLVAVFFSMSAGAQSIGTVGPIPATTGCPGAIRDDLCKIDHVIVIVQENRSFDHYFGVYKNPNGLKVDGIPRKPSGKFKPCIPDPMLPGCQRPFHTGNPVNKGGPHAHIHSVVSVDHGKMDGFIKAA